MPKQYSIIGSIIPLEGNDRAGVKVQAFERDLPSLERRRGSISQMLGQASTDADKNSQITQRLGEAITDAEGYFQINYTLEQFQAGEGIPPFRRLQAKNADLSFRIFDRKGQKLNIKSIEAMGRGFGPDQIIFNVPAELEVNIYIEHTHQAVDSEYEKLLAMIAPVIEEVPLVELTDEDVSFLLNELGVEQLPQFKQWIEWLRRSALLAQETNLPTEAFYGWGRVDFPLPFYDLATIPLKDLAQIADRLFDTDKDRRRETLLKACEEHIIPNAWCDRLKELDRQLKLSRPLKRHGTGKLIDAENGEPLTNYTVEMTDPNGRGVRSEPASARTDSSGLFPILYISRISSDDSVPHALHLKILNQAEKPIFETKINIESVESRVFELKIPIPITPEPDAHNLSELGRATNLEIPRVLLSFLSSAGIKTLGDIRRNGGISQLKGLPIKMDHPVIHRLEAHADLSRVSPDTRSNEFLIEKGYHSVRAIAESTRGSFVREVHVELGDFNAAKLHAVAGAQMYFLNNVIAGFTIDQANNYAHVENILTDETVLTQSCSCKDCEAAVSPLVYLIDLVTYTLQHVTSNGAPITLQTLTDTFHQPFTELSVSCESVNARVRQVRLCVEVLRAFIGSRPLGDASKEATLSAAEQAYRLAAYQALLLAIGTSYAELRLAQDADFDTRQSLADRLQVEVSRLSELYLDPANPAVLTEARLEQLFGLVDTNRDPLASATVPDLQTWRLKNLRTLWRTQDFTDDVYDNGRNVVALKQVPGGVVFAPPALAAKIVHDTASQQLIFEGQMSFEERGTLLALTADADFQRAIKQLYHISKRLPVIDPDLISPDDLCELSSGNKAFDLWKTRRKWVDDRLTALSAIVKTLVIDGKAESIPDLDAMLAAMYTPIAYGAVNSAAWVATTPVTDFEKLSEELETTDSEAAKFRIEDELNLSVESFAYLMRIRAKDKAWLADHRSEIVSASEWQDLRSILMQAHKVRFFLAWREEEHTAGLVFGPQVFWISLTQPSEGIWPPAENTGIPLIDPGTMKQNELPDPILGERALKIWADRLTRLSVVRAELKKRRETLGFEPMLRWALGHPKQDNPLQYDLNSLKKDLNDKDVDVVNDAMRKITEDLHLSVEGFRRLQIIKVKNEDPDPAKKPAIAEWEEIYTLLTSARKIKHEFPIWIQEEKNPVTGIVYWSALKAKLPPWRSSLDLRAGWQTALRARSRAAVIDPDLIGLDELRNPVAGDRAFDLFQSRQAAIAAQMTQLQANPKTPAGYEACLKMTIGLTWPQFLNISDQLDQGHTISMRLDQLSLDFRRFNSLVRIGRLAAAGETILNSEWQDVYDILLQVWKERNVAIWLAQEKDANVLLDPELFLILSDEGISLPSEPTNMWRSSLAARQEWEEKLQTRIDQEAAVVAVLHSAVETAEERTLTGLRDALIGVTTAPASSTDPQIRLDQQGKWITENLLIDAKAGGCMMTTRVAQAIEVIQGLIHSLRTGQPHDLFQTWVLDLTNFDEEWKWLGSYPSWRGAMFVWMYPELLAQPSLRQNKTPGFEALLENTRENRDFMPKDACREAKRYAEYFQDICTLSAQVTCLARTRVYKTDDCNMSFSDERCFLYMFGLGGVTNTVYWSRYDFQSSSGYAQSFWKSITSQIPDFNNIVELLGAVPFQVSTGERYIFLLAKKIERNTASLVCAKYDLDNNRWNQEKILTLDTPMRSGDFKAVVCQSDTESEAPHVLFYGRTNDNYDTLYRERKLNVAGSGWEDGDFRPLYLGYMTDLVYKQMRRVLACAVRFEQEAFIAILEDENTVITFKCSPNPDKNQANRYYAEIQPRPDFSGYLVGAFSFAVDNVFLMTSRLKVSFLGWPLSIFTEQHTLYSLNSLFSLSPNSNIPVKELVSPFPGDNYISDGTRTRLLPTWGLADDNTGKSKRLIYSFRSQTEHHQPVLIRDPSGEPNHFLKSSGLPVLPNIDGPFNISTELTDAELLARRDLEWSAFIKIQSYPLSLLTYLQEAYYSVPLSIALALQRSGEYVAALDWFRITYADGLGLGLRKIYPELRLEESLPNNYERAKDWLLDPLDPHKIAATRGNAYTRYTILAIVRCLLDYADAEFTKDTVESNSIALRLYLRALELLEAPELKQHLMDQCEEVIGILEDFPDVQWHGQMTTLRHELRSIPNLSILTQTVSDINQILQSNESPAKQFEKTRTLIAQVRAQLPKAPTLREVLQEGARTRDVIQKSAAANRHVASTLDTVGALAAEDFQRSVSVVTGISPALLIKKSTILTWLREPFQPNMAVDSNFDNLTFKVRQDGVVMDSFIHTFQGELAQVAESQPHTALSILKGSYSGFVPSQILGFCIPRNSLLNTLRKRAEINLLKLRTCRNIAGLKRTLEPYAASINAQIELPQSSTGSQIIGLSSTKILAPTLYRYNTLIERSKQLVQLAAQMEAAMFAALQRRDEAALRLFEAGQKLELAEAGVRLQDLRLKEATDKVDLATLQSDKAHIQLMHYTTLLEDDQNHAAKQELEYAALYAYGIVENIQSVMASIVMTRNTPEGTSVFASSIAQEVYNSYYRRSGDAGAASALAGPNISLYSTRAAIYSLKASLELRRKEWEFQRDLADQDVIIATQQIQVANDEENVVQQERVIASIQQTQARDAIEYLTTKQFNTVELNEWMSDVLQGVYRFFLQQATSMARLAENQLAFERQEIMPTYIQSDYWVNTEHGDVGTGNSSVDRKGLTGSARLLQDIYQLDQYAFDSKKRKLPLSKTISLANLAPIEFQRFRESGVIVFATPMELFDRDFPGHYLRLINKVSVSVVALIPPLNGIHATFASVGLSRVVIGPDVFQRVTIRRDPEFIALSSPINSTGVFELEPQTDMLRPFEGTGVDTRWELRMPKAANQFDYRTLADVLLTIDYTALSSIDYRQQVIQSLPSLLQADASFSFRNQFADQWYDLNNSDQTKTPMKVRFRTFREDFPPNIDFLKIQQVSLYFVRASQKLFELPITELRFTEQSNQGTVGGSAVPIDGLISTRQGNGGSWTPLIGKSPVGEWELTLPNIEEVKNRFKNEDIVEILLVITYSGRTPDWPN